MFSPNLGRWMTMDPIGYEAGDENLYRYVGNDPVNGLDPSGLHRERESAPPPRRAWDTQPGPGVELGRYSFPNSTWNESNNGDGKNCKGDVTVTVFGFRQNRTFNGDNRRGNFRVYLEIRYTYTNIRCSTPCNTDEPENDRNRTVRSETMGNHIFLEGEISTYCTRYKPKSLDEFEYNFLKGYYSLTPVK